LEQTSQDAVTEYQMMMMFNRDPAFVKTMPRTTYVY